MIATRTQRNTEKLLTRRKADGHPRAIPDRECFRVNLRDRLCCAMCGRGPSSRERSHKGFEYHHVTPVREGGLGVAENLLLLCRRCHRLADRGHLPVPSQRLNVPESVTCHACGAHFDTRTAETGCDWYRCGVCGSQMALYDHFEDGGPDSG